MKASTKSPMVYWPGTEVPRSTGNGFELVRRRAQGPSVLANLTSKQATAGAHGGHESASVVPAVAGLSERAQKQLKATGRINTIGKTDPDRARRIRKAAI